MSNTTTCGQAAALFLSIARDHSHPARAERCAEMAKLMEQAEANERRWRWLEEHPGHPLAPVFENGRWMVWTEGDHAFHNLAQAVDFAMSHK